MRYFKHVVFSILLCAFALAPFAASANTLPYVVQSTEMRGLWVTSAYNLDWPSRQDLTPAQNRAEIDDILTRAANQGINAVFVQVRPVADALYRSEIFPWSHLLTGTQGVAPADGFDPLEYWITAAHARGIQVHAWLNPYRVTFPNQQITNPAQLSATHPARLNPDLVIAYGTGLFFDPGNPAARQLIVDGVEELLRNYNLDGIHLDDYFYPGRYFPDQATFARHGGGMQLYDWRRENVNILIRDLQRITHQTRPGAVFGVSPFAIWRNSQNDPQGSATNGNESYVAHFADTRRWVLEGWVDYIVPQIYWIEGNPAACFEVVLTWWEDLVAGTDVRLYIGLAPYREIEGRPGWEGQIIRQMERIARSPVANGSIFFRERFMRNHVGDAIGAFYAQHLPGQVPTRLVGAPPPATPIPTPPPTMQPAVRMDRLLVAQPSGANFTVTDASGFWFHGSGLPDVPVYVNGELITDRTAEGFFSVFMPLSRGQNTFTFTQTGQQNVVRTITNNAPAVGRPPATMAVGIENAFPAQDEWVLAGTEITLRATAPAGATVTAEFAGETVNLTQAGTATSTESNILAAQFSGSFTISSISANDAIISLGSPVYTMTWNGHSRTVTAAGDIQQLGTHAPHFAIVTAPSVWVFPQAGTTGGSNWMLLYGQIDRVTAISGNWTRLQSGGWVQNEYIRTFRDANLVPPAVPGARDCLGFLSEGRYITGPYYDTITWAAPFFPGAIASFDGSELILTLGMQSAAPPIFHTPGEMLFSDIRIGTHNGAAAYFMTLREDARLEGFYTTHADDQFKLVLRHRRPLTQGNYPFYGFTFAIDAGHGGTDPGALGPMAGELAEAHIVLAQLHLISDRLEALGATVVRIRDGNELYTLQRRVDISRAANPDMFISLHTNSTAETTNATNIRGFTVWFRNENSRSAAETFLDVMHYVNPGTNRAGNVHQANFYVCRPVWSPAILLEASFTNNIHDFAWLINPRAQEEYARAVVNALLAYYR